MCIEHIIRYIRSAYPIERVCSAIVQIQTVNLVIITGNKVKVPVTVHVVKCYMSRRAGIYNKIDQVFREDWLDEQEAAAIFEVNEEDTEPA